MEPLELRTVSGPHTVVVMTSMMSHLVTLQMPSSVAALKLFLAYRLPPSTLSVMINI